MMPYIDRDKVIKELSTMYKSPTSSEDFMTVGYDHAIADVVVTVHEQPIADVVEGVRCKDCEFYYAEEKWCRRLGLCGAFNGDGFCSHGERKETDDAEIH